MSKPQKLSSKVVRIDMDSIIAERIRKYFIIVAILGLISVVLFVAWRVLLFGSATVVITSTHDPINTAVYTQDALLVPSAEGGKNYKFSAKTGIQKVTIAGPYIKTQTIEVPVEQFSDTQISVETEQLTLAELAKSLVEEKNSQKITEVKKFGEDGEWLVVNTKNENIVDLREISVFYYEFGEAKWKLVASGEKVDISSDKNLDIPADLEFYVGEYAGD